MADPGPSDSSSKLANRATAIAALAFFLSGAAALMDEVCWIRRASLVFGSTTHALSTVLAVFFLGLALGSEWFGRRSLAAARPLRLYVALEAGLAALVLASLPAFGLAEWAYGHAYRALAGNAAALTAVRVALVACVLLPPTVLMGGTLPLMCRALVREHGRIGRSVGWLYALNTLGAAAGCAAAGLWLLPRIGLSGTLALAAALSLAAAALALTLGAALAPPARAAAREEPVLGDAPPAATAAPPRPGDGDGMPAADARSGDERRVVMLLFFLSGFAALAYEVLWTRFLGLVIRNTVLTYTLTLLVVLVGIVLGSLLAARVADRARHRAVWFGALQLATAVLVLALMRMPPAFWARFQGSLAAYLVLLLPPAVLSGAAFPIGVRMLVRDAAVAGAGVGRAAALNTLGGILGSLTAGFALLPGLGLAASVQLVTGLSLATGLVALFALATPPLARRALALGGAALWLAVPLALRTAVPADFLRGRAELVDFREGLMSHVAVLRMPGSLELEIDRWWQGRDRPTQQIVAAHVPALLHPAPRRVLVVGVGAGQTPSRFLMHPVERVDCVDIEPAVFDVVRRHFGGAWMRDPRVRLLAEDGRNHVAHGGERYDVIALEVGQVFRPGVPVFYTEDFYRRVRARLAPGGLVSQFVSLASLPPGVFPRIVASFVRVFPTAALWSNTSEVLMLGFTADSLVIDRSRFARLASDAALARDLEYRPWGDARYALRHEHVFLGGFLCGPRGMAAIGAGVRPYRDDRPELDYATLAVSGEQAHELELVPLLRAHLEPVNAHLRPPLAPERVAAADSVRALDLGDMECVALLRRIPALGGMVGSDEEVALLERALAANPLDGAANRLMGEARISRGEVASALVHYAHALEVDPGDALALRDLGLILQRTGRAAEALPRLAAAAARMPRDAETRAGLGAALAALGRLGEAREQLALAVRLDPTDAEARRMLGRLDGLLETRDAAPAPTR